MTQMLYLECSAGISGDMTAAALIDLGASEEKVRRALASLPVEGFEVRITRVAKSGLDVCDFNVVLDAAHENHDHDMAYLHGAAAHAHAHEGGHVDAGPWVHAHAPKDGESRGANLAHDAGFGHAHAHAHRGMREIAGIIKAADMTRAAKDKALRIFGVLAEAEAQAHGLPIEEVHFHEVGAVDSIADVVAIAVALDDLAFDEVVVTELAEGRGTVRCQHGIIPVPVPAVVNIARAHAIALRVLDVCGELVTPTGAAVVAAVRTRSSLPERFVVKRVGMGAGKRAYETSGILRALAIEPVSGL